jgi:hypothetical protein
VRNGEGLKITIKLHSLEKSHFNVTYMVGHKWTKSVITFSDVDMQMEESLVYAAYCLRVLNEN